MYLRSSILYPEIGILQYSNCIFLFFLLFSADPMKSEQAGRFRTAGCHGTECRIRDDRGLDRAFESTKRLTVLNHAVDKILNHRDMPVRLSCPCRNRCDGSFHGNVFALCGQSDRFVEMRRTGRPQPEKPRQTATFSPYRSLKTRLFYNAGIFPRFPVRIKIWGIWEFAPHGFRDLHEFPMSVAA